eukprot:TRINITY_DN1295_c0_g1_i3.p1 TRINITY_DN1295_c0_g1~~TRINITY_DN1295_c0_g1_i3.p1  ORF type:complete len:194 (+),score=17.51 TRINITY_DN1295_c0_g1_i3:291-872(+)
MVRPTGKARASPKRSTGSTNRRKRVKKESFDSVYDMDIDSATTIEFMQDPVNTDEAEVQVSTGDEETEGVLQRTLRLPRYQQACILAILVLGLACAVILFIVYRIQEKEDIERYFVVSMNERLAFIENTLQGILRTMAVLGSYQTITLAQGPVVDADFQDFVNVLNENSTEAARLTPVRTPTTCSSRPTVTTV